MELIEKALPLDDDEEIMLERRLRLEKQRQADAKMLSRQGPPLTIDEVLDRIRVSRVIA
jgi:hypothetical protein